MNNNGPDALSNNYIDLDSAWLCADAKNQDVVSDNNTRMFKASPYLSQGDNGQWVVIDSETRVRLNVVLQSRCYTEYLVPQAFFKFGPVGKPSEEWIEQNVKLIFKAWIVTPHGYSDPNPGKNTAVGYPGPLE